MTTGEKILKLRKARGWSQEELAGQLNVTRQAVSRWESNASKPDADKIVDICDLFGISADYLLRDTYTGERVAVEQPAPESKPAAKMDHWQILGLVMLIMGCLVFLVLCIVSSMVMPHGIIINGYSYGALDGFVVRNRLGWLVCLLVALILSGTAFLVKMNILELLRTVSRRLGITWLLTRIWESDMLHDLRTMFGPNE